jgi:hypothetical protein
MTSDTPKKKQKSILTDFEPKQFAHFGWNYNFKANCADNPSFNYTFPGGRGYIRLFEPYVRAHVGIQMNFSSTFTNIQKAPHVTLRLAVEGHAVVSGKMVSLLNVEEDVTGDPFNRFEIPILQELRDATFLPEIAFNIGNVPVSFSPGIQFEAKAYHIGRFKGSLQLGLQTHIKIEPVLRYDSEVGVDTNFTSKLMHLELWPPTWLIWTKHFEMGALLEPQIWMKGRLGDVKNAQMGMGLKPYINMTISQEGALDEDIDIVMRPLIVYPFRAAGLPECKLYVIKVGANGMYRHT